MKKLLEQAIGVLFGLLLMTTVLLRLPAAYVHAATYRMRRAALRRGMPRATGTPALLLRAVAKDRSISPGLRSLLALEQARVADFDGARRTLAESEQDLSQLRRFWRPFARTDLDPQFETERLNRSRRRLAAMDLPDRLDLERETEIFLKLSLAASAAVVSAAERGDFDEAIRLALSEGTDPISLQPVRSLALIACRQHARGEFGAGATLRLAHSIAAGLSNWWPIGDDSGYRERAFELVAVLQVHTGHADEALRTLDDVRDSDTADTVARHVAVRLASRGDMTAAASLIWSIVDPDQRAKACIDAVQVWPGAATCR